jgi:predicted transporter
MGDVVLFDESFAFQDSRARWLYTGFTRAAKRLSVVAAAPCPCCLTGCRLNFLVDANRFKP